MSKKKIYFDEAERLYTIEQFTINEIAIRLNMSEKCIRNWKKEGNWDKKKQSHLEKKVAFHEELYDFGRDLIRSVKEDMAEGKKVDTGRLYTLGKILPMILKVKNYEDLKLSKETETIGKGLTEEVLRKIEQEVLGIG